MDKLYPFTLPGGYVDAAGTPHREGAMRLATARDELVARRHPQSQGNPPYFTLLILSRVIERLGTLEGDAITPEVLEALPSTDLKFLRDFYRKTNGLESDDDEKIVCPHCGQGFSLGGGGGEEELSANLGHE